MMDAFGREISFTQPYAFTHAEGGVRTTFIGAVSPVSETHVTMTVSETLCFNMHGELFENRTWSVRNPREVNANVLFPLSSSQIQLGV